MKILLPLVCIIFLQCTSAKQTFDVTTATAAEIGEAIHSKRTTSYDVTKHFLDKIQKEDEQGVNSVIATNPDALEHARRLDEELKTSKPRSPLHGVPILIKDNIETKDRMATTAGSIVLKDNYAEHDAFIISKIREAGMVILGKTNLSEWANFRSTNSSSGWSSMGGQTKNAHDLKKSPCGSSSGSGAAVSAGMAPIAIGTETDGSIACPASVNGIVGIKPTVGLWSRTGIIPISHTQDTPGPMAISVMDAAMLLGLSTGVDTQDELSKSGEKDYTKYCTQDGLKDKKIGIDTFFLQYKGEIGDVFRHNISLLESEGAIVIPLSYRNLLQYGSEEYTLLLYEFKDGINRYLANKNLGVNTLTDLIEANETQKEKIQALFGQEIFRLAEEKGDLNDESYLTAKYLSHIQSRNVIDSLFKAHQLDAIVGPTLGPAWNIDHINGDQFNGPSSYSPFSRAGYPHITLPMGKVDNLPVGISFLGRYFSEGTLISMAYSFEQRSTHIETKKQ